MTRRAQDVRSRVRRALPVIVAAVGLLGSACSGNAEKQVASAAATSTTPSSTAQAAAPTTTERPVKLSGTMALDPAKGPAGTAVTVQARGLPADTPLKLLWATDECRWVLKGDQREEYHGRQCDPKDVQLASLTSDSSGALATSFAAPEGFGFAHDVLLVDNEGAVRNKALFDVAIQAAITPQSGPVGTPITITVKGMGVDALENNRQILYDNAYTGWVSAITTRGSATAVIPATGTPGTHVIQVARGAFTFPYLNPAQSPRPDIPVFDFHFTVTDGPPVLPAPPARQTPAPKPSQQAATASGPSIAADVASGPVGTQVELTGMGFPGRTDVKLHWFRIVGNRVAGQGWEERNVDLASVRSSAEGTFQARFAIPGDVGGPHRIEAIAAGASPARTSVTVTPTALPLTTAAGPVGSAFTIHLSGVGWTETANIYTAVYDNQYIGYACGFNSQGDVKIPMIATGAPGWHFVDLYPAIYKGEEPGGQQSFRIPQLTFARDHPGEDLPAFHFAFEITG